MAQTTEPLDETFCSHLRSWTSLHRVDLQLAVISALDLCKNHTTLAEKALELEMEYASDHSNESCIRVKLARVIERPKRVLPALVEQAPSSNLRTTNDWGYVSLVFNLGGEIPVAFTTLFRMDGLLMNQEVVLGWKGKLGIPLAVSNTSS